MAYLQNLLEDYFIWIVVSFAIGMILGWVFAGPKRRKSDHEQVGGN